MQFLCKDEVVSCSSLSIIEKIYGCRFTMLSRAVFAFDFHPLCKFCDVCVLDFCFSLPEVPRSFVT